MRWLTLAMAVQRPHQRGAVSLSFTEGVSLEHLRAEQHAFVTEREWSRFHSPRSLALALMGEVGEVAELLQWRGDNDAQPGLASWSHDEKVRLGEELSDVLSYVIRLADVAEIDLPLAFLDKLEKNRAKYPAEQVRGSSAKYIEYRKAARAAEQVEAMPAAAAPKEQAQQQQDPQRAGEREWGQPLWVSEAYERAAARVEAKLGRQASAPTADVGTAAKDAVELPRGAGEVELDSARWASDVYARAKAKAGVDQNGLPADEEPPTPGSR